MNEQDALQAASRPAIRRRAADEAPSYPETPVLREPVAKPRPVRPVKPPVAERAPAPPADPTPPTSQPSRPIPGPRPTPAMLPNAARAADNDVLRFQIFLSSLNPATTARLLELGVTSLSGYRRFRRCDLVMPRGPLTVAQADEVAMRLAILGYGLSEEPDDPLKVVRRGTAFRGGRRR